MNNEVEQLIMDELKFTYRMDINIWYYNKTQI